MLAEGASFNTIKQRLRTTAPTISPWKQRFLASGMDGVGCWRIDPLERQRICGQTYEGRLSSITHRES
jgi:hypothetical protein